jgi:hypothetical protein
MTPFFETAEDCGGINTLVGRAVTSWQPQHHFIAADAVVRQPYNPRPLGQGFFFVFVSWFYVFSF